MSSRCGNTCQIWMWVEGSNRYLGKIKNVRVWQISELTFSNFHPRLGELTTSTGGHLGVIKFQPPGTPGTYKFLGTLNVGFSYGGIGCGSFVAKRKPVIRRFYAPLLSSVTITDWSAKLELDWMQVRLLFSSTDISSYLLGHIKCELISSK